ncbi:hypothetical protein GCM10010172_13920 [Paractinoplanes ferrugineus]|uniref:HEAT repeat protein n=1 Tax=Paractinoplanes ferrugineus TaxID=113564 RepID=A0A919IXX3_9ACTN|nr:HEAT repeat domain-containing protein [Actinoplanes ferrugineus]GIE09957.1 hypothetical protein Afe05nite_17970 [Actinoplanes ferrugineus]
MGRRAEYRNELAALDAARWPDYLTERSGLPGPRGNIELAQAVADAGDRLGFDRLIATGDEYLVFCGVLGLGRLLAEEDEGAARLAERLRAHAADERWRVREAVAMALQRLGDADPARLRALVAEWVRDDDPLVVRAAVAGICEPRLLKRPEMAAAAVDACTAATARVRGRELRQALGYCWSVAVAADPGAGLPRFRALTGSADADVRWIVRENTRKVRLAKLLS